MPSISVRRLYQDNQTKLQLAWSAGTAGADNRISVDADKPVLALVGHLNFIHPNQVQVLGVAEVEYLNKMESGEVKASFDELFELTMALVVVANDLPVPYMLRDYCHTHSVPLLTSKAESPFLMDVLRIYLQRVLATSTVKHGVFLDVFEVGVLITGQSGLGKSELALELISRGHGLVADDAVELYRTGPETLEGRCPPMLRDFLEVRGLGVLNIRQMFGDTAVKRNKYLRMIVHLSKPSVAANSSGMERLTGDLGSRRVLDLDVPMITIPVMAGRNLAVLTEAATRTHILRSKGIDPAAAFMARHSHFLERAT